MSDELVARSLESLLSVVDAPAEVVPLQRVQAAAQDWSPRHVAQAVMDAARVCGLVHREPNGFRLADELVVLLHGVDRRRHFELMARRDALAARWRAAIEGWHQIVERHRLIEPSPSDLGSSFGPGWLALIDETMRRLVAAGWDRRVMEVKSKFCRLVIYLGGDYTPRLVAILRDAELTSGACCEDCGERHNLETPRAGTALCSRCEAR